MHHIKAITAALAAALAVAASPATAAPVTARVAHTTTEHTNVVAVHDSHVEYVTVHTDATSTINAAGGGTTAVTVTETFNDCYFFFCLTRFEFHLWKSWNYTLLPLASISNVQERAYTDHIDNFFQLNGPPAVQNWWEAYYWWLPHSGHGTWAQQRIDNCIFRIGCLATHYPWAQIDSYPYYQGYATKGGAG